MGFWGYNNGIYENVPNEQLDFNQRHIKKWQSDIPFSVSSGGSYSREARSGIDGRLRNSLGLTDIDDLLEMKAPRLFKLYTDTSNNVINLCEYTYKNLSSNNKFQQLLGKYEELQERCRHQEAMIEKLMAQNEQLQAQLLEKANAASSFSR